MGKKSQNDSGNNKKNVGERLFRWEFFKELIRDTLLAIALFLVCFAIERLGKLLFPNNNGPVLYLFVIAIWTGVILSAITIIAYATIYSAILLKFAFQYIKNLWKKWR